MRAGAIFSVRSPMKVPQFVWEVFSSPNAFGAEANSEFDSKELTQEFTPSKRRRYMRVGAIFSAAVTKI